MSEWVNEEHSQTVLGGGVCFRLSLYCLIVKIRKRLRFYKTGYIVLRLKWRAWSALLIVRFPVV